jgi:adenylate cyclase
MALWNAPTSAAEHARRACRAALGCREAVRGLDPRLATRFGLHRDPVMVGHFGAPDRMSYTAMGDGVNLASRLEGLNKRYGTSIIASETIFEAAREEFSFRLLDRVAVKGKAKGVRIYELLGPRGPAPAAVERYEGALALYFARRFDEAMAALAGCGDDRPSAALHERCATLARTPPPATWDGVWVFEEK